ncbi:MAG: 30S ribosome-binding factor RbfA [Eubacteriales bacterium]
MSKHRKSRINDAMTEALATAVREMADPRIAGNLVSITRVDTTPDLKIARVYFSTMGDDAEVKTALLGASGMLRRHLALTLNLRLTPALQFYRDHGMEHGARIARLLSELDLPPAPPPDKPES